MSKENNENLDSLNGENDEVVTLDENDDIDALREKFTKLSDSHKKASEANKKLYARAKKGEGFEMKDGKWTKAEKPFEKPTSPQEPSKLSEFEIDYGKKAYLKAFGIQGADELELVKSEINRSGLELDELVSNEYFMGKIKTLRDAKESANAIPKGKNRSGQTGITDVDVAVAKYNESGELPQDFTTRNKVIDAITKAESAPLFQGPSVNGPLQ